MCVFVCLDGGGGVSCLVVDWVVRGLYRPECQIPHQPLSFSIPTLLSLRTSSSIDLPKSPLYLASSG